MAAVLYIDRQRLKDQFAYTAVDGERKLIQTQTEIDEPDSELRRVLPLQHDRWGVPVKPDHVPTRLKLEGTRSGKEWDYENLYTSPLISERLKTLIEEFEPGVHQFWPMLVENNQGVIFGTRYWWVICNRLDAFDRERSIPRIEKSLYLGLGGYGPEEGSRPLLRCSAISGHHAWRDARSTVPAPFVSTTLAKAMRAEGITGAVAFPIEEI